MFTNRLFHLLILAVILALTACAPQVEPASTVAPTDTAAGHRTPPDIGED